MRVWRPQTAELDLEYSPRPPLAEVGVVPLGRAGRNGDGAELGEPVAIDVGPRDVVAAAPGGERLPGRAVSYTRGATAVKSAR